MSKRVPNTRLSDLANPLGKPTSAPTPSQATPSSIEGDATINVKIPYRQHLWLNETARRCRTGNKKPLAPAERVYPQHLIRIAIDLLESSGVDWAEMATEADIRRKLKLK